jgi:prepilin peptidase CpaA
MVSVAILAPDVLCVLVCIVAAVTDLRSRRIPNWLTLGAAALGLVVNTTLCGFAFGFGEGVRLGLVPAIAGGLLLGIIFGVLGLINFVGMGDFKLMVAVGVLLRWPTALWALAYVALAGGVIAVGYALLRGRMGKVLGNLLSIGRNLVKPKDDRPPVELHRIPYALAILVGATWAAAIKYFPVLRVP